MTIDDRQTDDKNLVQSYKATRIAERLKGIKENLKEPKHFWWCKELELGIHATVCFYSSLWAKFLAYILDNFVHRWGEMGKKNLLSSICPRFMFSQLSDLGKIRLPSSILVT